MATKANDIFRKQGDILKRIDKQANALRKGGAVATRQIVDDKRQMLTGLERRLTRAKEARKSELARLDKEIEALTGKVKTLSSEIEKDLKAISGKGRGRGGSGGRQRRLTTVKGIGDVAAKKLRKHGITEIATLAGTKPSQLAEILGTSAKRAREIIAAAKGNKA